MDSVRNGQRKCAVADKLLGRLIAILTLSSDFKEGLVVLGHKQAVSYLKAVRRLITLDIADEEIKDDFRKFLKILHKHVAGIQDKLSSRNIIKDFLNSSLKSFDGIELTVHIICIAFYRKWL